MIAITNGPIKDLEDTWGTVISIIHGSFQWKRYSKLLDHAEDSFQKARKSPWSIAKYDRTIKAWWNENFNNVDDISWGGGGGG